MSFFQTRGLEGFDIAYDSTKKHDTGVIDADLLPAKSILYRYYFTLNPAPVDESILGPGGFGGLGGGLLALPAVFGSEVRFSTDRLEFLLDFVTTQPRFNLVFEATADNVGGGGTYLEFRENVFTVSYIFEVEQDPNTLEITHLYNKSGAMIPVDPNATPPYVNSVALPTIPPPDERGKAWFDFYQSFSSSGEYANYNMFQGKVKSDAFDYTLNNRFTGKATDTNRVKIRNLSVGKKYLVAYEGITEFLYRQRVRLEFTKANFISGGVSLNGYDAPFVQNREFEHYLWKSWTDPATGETLSGWRISEQWFGRRPVNTSNPTNPDLNEDSTSIWGVFNMTEENLQIPDDQRSSYNRNFALELQRLASANSTPSTGVDTNNVNESNAASDNFEIEFVANNVVNYSGEGDVIVDVGGPMGVLFRANDLTYQGYWESQFYKTNLPRNTRIINTFNLATNGVVGIVIAVKIQRGANDATCSQDPPALFFTSNGKLFSKVFEDSLHATLLGSKVDTSLEERKKRLTQAPSPGQKGVNSFPGNDIVLPNFSYRTFIDDSLLTSSVSPKSGGTSSTVTTSISNVPLIVEPSAATLQTDPPHSIGNSYVFGVSTDSGAALNQLQVKIKLASNRAANLKIRGWTSEPANFGTTITEVDFGDAGSKREVAGITVEDDKVVKIDLGAWQEVGFLEFICDAEIASISDVNVSVFKLSDDSLANNYINDATSVAALTDGGGNVLLFYTNKDDRLNLAYTANWGFSYGGVENILLRGDSIGNLKGMTNRSEDTYYLFHSYKDALLCTPFKTSIFDIVTDDLDKKAEAVDIIRRQVSHLVWGNVFKDPSNRQTQVNGSGQVTFEDIYDNVILTDADKNNYRTKDRPLNAILQSSAAVTTPRILSDFNKFITIGALTNNSGLATSNPDGFDYTVYDNGSGVFRLLILVSSDVDSPTYRLLNSSDGGVNWVDGWRYKKDSTNPSSQIVRINSLSDGQDTEEGENIFALYDNKSGKVNIFYFYLGVILCKTIDDSILDSGNIDAISDTINSSPVYAVAGNLSSVDAESRTPSNPTGKVIFGNFQRDPDNFTKYYSSDIYSPQAVSGYVTKEGYYRVFVLRDSRIMDAYYYNGVEWIPEHTVIT
jgi:hypothetical protein